MSRSGSAGRPQGAGSPPAPCTASGGKGCITHPLLLHTVGVVSFYALRNNSSLQVLVPPGQMHLWIGPAPKCPPPRVLLLFPRKTPGQRDSFQFGSIACLSACWNLVLLAMSELVVEAPKPVGSPNLCGFFPVMASLPDPRSPIPHPGTGI